MRPARFPDQPEGKSVFYGIVEGGRVWVKRARSSVLSHPGLTLDPNSMCSSPEEKVGVGGLKVGEGWVLPKRESRNCPHLHLSSAAPSPQHSISIPKKITGGECDHGQTPFKLI